MTEAPARPQPPTLIVDPDDAEYGESAHGQRLPPHRQLTAEQARALSLQLRSVSPWRVIAVQAALGGAIALVVMGLTRNMAVAMSALYGGLVVVVPGALMARGMTSRLSSVNVGTSAVSVMLWALVKIAVSVGLLMLAPKIVSPLSWPALLVALVACIQVYWLALRWRRPLQNSN